MDKITSGILSGQVRKIINYIGNTKIATLETALTQVVSTMPTYLIYKPMNYGGLIFDRNNGEYLLGSIKSITETNILNFMTMKLASLILKGTSNQLVFMPSENRVKISVNEPVATRIYTIPDVKSDSTFQLTNIIVVSEPVHILPNGNSKVICSINSTLQLPIDESVGTMIEVIVKSASPGVGVVVYVLPGGSDTIYTGNVVITATSITKLVYLGNGEWMKG